MKIGIDVKVLCRSGKGISTYVSSLLNEFERSYSEEEVILYSPKKINCCFNGRVTLKTGPSWPDNLWMHTALPHKICKDSLDVFHSPDFILPAKLSIPSVITVHDLISYKYPKWTESKYRIMQKMLLNRSLKKAVKVIVPSRCTANDLKKYFDIDESKIEVIHLGVKAEFRKHSAEEKNNIRKKYSLPEEYLFYAGTWEERKGSRVLEKSMRILSEKGVGIPLYAIGNKVCDNDNIIFLPYMDTVDLASVMSAARIFLFPSYYEGFGLPPLEAMASGLPVISTKAGSLYEVLGEAAIFAKEGSPEDLADKTERLLTDDELRAVSVAKGFAQAKKFSWERAAESTMKVYADVANSY